MKKGKEGKGNKVASTPSSFLPNRPGRLLSPFLSPNTLERDNRDTLRNTHRRMGGYETETRRDEEGVWDCNRWQH